MTPKVYLAGPDVFLPDAAERADAQRHICARHGLLAITPLDRGPDEDERPDAPSIARRNEAHIRRCDAVFANLTPFRGPGADAGTVYEVGFARALGRPVFGYACAAGDYASRVRRMPGAGERDAQGLEIEDFGLYENLMVSCGIEASGGFVLAEHTTDPWADLSIFERCAEQAAAVLRRLVTA